MKRREERSSRRYKIWCEVKYSKVADIMSISGDTDVTEIKSIRLITDFLYRWTYSHLDTKSPAFSTTDPIALFDPVTQ